MQQISSAAYSDTKPHYRLLDGLRGVAALLVMFYHIFEGFATSPIDQRFNHGYLAVDFFFILSGFVMGYAYDDRWGKSMNEGGFFKRRLIRLHPMVIMGTIIGLCTYLIQGSVTWSGVHIAFSNVMVAIVCGFLMIPVSSLTSFDVRGNGEMFPLNGPSWSLFFEYIGNIIYALMLRRLSTKMLSAFVALTGIGLATFAIGNYSGYGNIGVGWTMADNNFIGGLLRLTFSYSMGLLLSRTFKPVKIRGAFWICAAILTSLLAVPHMDGEEAVWMNGIYDSFCVIVAFPIIVYLAASGTTTDAKSSSICRFLGDISYPLYMVHYPIMYLLYAYVWDRGLDFSQAWPVAAAAYFGSIALAFICWKFYDEPVRKWLTAKFVSKKR